MLADFTFPSRQGGESEFISPGRIRGEIKRGVIVDASFDAGGHNGAAFTLG